MTLAKLPMRAEAPLSPRRLRRSPMTRRLDVSQRRRYGVDESFFVDHNGTLI